MTQTTSQSKPTIEQQRAKHAWQAVERLKVGSQAADAYAREAKKLPVRIMTSGLGCGTFAPRGPSTSFKPPNRPAPTITPKPTMIQAIDQSSVVSAPLNASLHETNGDDHIHFGRQNIKDKSERPRRVALRIACSRG